MKATKMLVMLAVTLLTIVGSEASVPRVHKMQIMLDYQGGQPMGVVTLPWVSTSTVKAEFMEYKIAFTLEKSGYDFAGYWTEPNGSGVMIYDANCCRVVTKVEFGSHQLYAYWVKKPTQKKGLVIILR